jgi:tetratricopeptide (TPR) repeat protein
MADVAVHLAHQHVKAKQDEAVDLSARAVEMGQRDYGDHDPKIALLLWQRGRCLRLRGLPSDSEQALRCYQSAREICQRAELETEPLGYLIALDLAETHLAAHRHSEAHRVIDEVERDCRGYQLTDTLVRCLFLRGWGHLLRDDFEAAEESLRNAYDLGLENNLDPALVIMAYIRFYRGRALFSLGRHQEASRILREHLERGRVGAAATYPDDMGLFAHAWSVLHCGDEKLLPEAQRAISRGLDAALVPSRRRSLPQFYLVRAIAQRQMGELDRAIKYLQQGLEEYDNFSMFRLYLHCRDTPKTRRDLEVTLAQYLMEQNVDNLKVAKHVHLQGIWKRQAALGPGHLRVALAELRYGVFLNQQGEFDEAKTQLEKTYEKLAMHSEAAPENVQKAAHQLVEVCTALQLPKEKNKWQQRVSK